MLIGVINAYDLDNCKEKKKELFMKVLLINSVPYGSTGHIMFSIAEFLEEIGNEVMCTSGYTWKSQRRKNYFLTSGLIEKLIHIYGAKITGYNGCFSIVATLRLINKIKRYKPDIIHIHNIHGWYLNLPIFWEYMRKHTEIKLVWTLHDCWAITGQCPHFIMSGCDKWKTGCHSCKQHSYYPKSWVDKSKQQYLLKRKLFCGMKNLTIVTPSVWLKQIIKESYLKEYDVKVINNGINLDVFKPRRSDFRKKNNLNDKVILLGVAYAWDEKKGLDVFIELRRSIPDKYAIVLVGTDSKVDSLLPEGIISIHRTQSQIELAEIYTAADIFINPTREDNYPTVHMEALACGTPIITFNTGGAAEMLNDECGTVIAYNDVERMIKEIIYIGENNPHLSRKCLETARFFSEKEKYREYLELYNSLL